MDYLCLYLGGTISVWQGVDFCIEPFPPTRYTPSVSYKFSQEFQSIALWDVYFLYFHLFKKINNYPYHARSMWKSDALCIFQTDKLILHIAGDWAFTLNPHTITLTAYNVYLIPTEKKKKKMGPADKVDYYSRFLFPLMFAVFNLILWSCYLLPDEERSPRMWSLLLVGS